MNPHVRFSLLVSFCLVGSRLNAQDQKAASVDQPQTGAIEGHVICDDTRSPARLATVLTIPIPIFDASGNATLPKVKGNDIAKTNLDGNYTLPKIGPGDYFVLAEIQGYLSPVAQFRWTDMKNLTPDTIKRLAKLLPSVHVEPGKTAHADVVIQRGASISGKVTYDDGAPAIRVYVRIDPAQDAPMHERHLIEGLASSWVLMTDDRGYYRINGLPDGDYVVEASADSTAVGGHPLADGGADLSPDRVYTQTYDTTYAERALHKKDAKVYKLTLGEDLSGADIEIPLHDLYSISGTVTVQGNQPPIVFGFVSLEDVNDKTLTRLAVIHSDGSFQFYYLPPAKYRLKTASVTDQAPIHILGEDRKPSHTYPEASTTVEIIDQGMSGVSLTIPEAAKPANPDTGKPGTPSGILKP